MLDFFKPAMRVTRNKNIEIYPSFIIGKSEDLMIRGGSFYAVWDDDTGLWSKDEFDVVRMVDQALWDYRDKIKDSTDGSIIVQTMREYSSKSWESYRRYISKCPDNFESLDGHLIFANTETRKEDYASKRLPYSLHSGDHSAWTELLFTLYEPMERQKIEWAIGAIISGDAKTIQKFLVFYGDAGTGKSTILNIIQKIFDGYYCIFDAKSLATSTNMFSMETFKSNPLVAIQHDGDLSRIEDNSKLNSIIAHEEMTINEKHKSLYTIRLNSFLFMATNKPVKITDAKSGLIRRLIDVNPSGKLIEHDRYNDIMSKIQFEIGAIAQHCLDVYNKFGKNYYDAYRSSEMQYKTDVFFNFVDDSFFIFSKQDGVSLKQAYSMYKDYCEETSLSYVMPMYSFREELKNYFRDFDARARIDGERYRSYYSGFKREKFEMYEDVGTLTELGVADGTDSIDILSNERTGISTHHDTNGDVRESNTSNKGDTSRGSSLSRKTDDNNCNIVLNLKTSIFDEVCSTCLAQYATKDGTPISRWANVSTTLKDIDTSKLHYVRLPENHIVIDFDLKDADGNKSAKLNLAAAKEFPPTYTEFSKSGAGVHLHYIYDGDSTQLSRLYSNGIEVKVFSGNSSLRRKLSYCNDLPIAHISGGLPLKEKKVISTKTIKSEKSLRRMIIRNLKKEIHPATKPSIDFIYKILDDAYTSGMTYDVTDMAPDILIFANNSTNQAPYCIKTVAQMRFKSKDMEAADEYSSRQEHKIIEQNLDSDEPIVFFDIEVFPNLLVVCYKHAGEEKIYRLINPTPDEVEDLFQLKLVGYNNRRYDNHILYARYLGRSNKELYQLSKAIINGTPEESKNAKFREAYNISFTDIYDFASAPNKMSLKKAEIEMGIHHQELGMNWDEPVPEDKWDLVCSYCDNDVIATEARFNWLKGDWNARRILADLALMTVNDSTNSLSTRFIFKNNKSPQNEFNYRDLSKPVSLNDISKETFAFLQETKPHMVKNPFTSPLANEIASVLPYFPGYECKWTTTTVNGKKIRRVESTYRGEAIGEGGYVYSEPGIYVNVALLDATSMHPTSMLAECIFGPRYTTVLRELIYARVAIKHEDWETVSKLLDGQLAPYVEMVLSGELTSGDLAGALKTVINSIYGLTYAKFDNAFKDRRNFDNIVAKRGALFMVDLKYAVQEQGYQVAHIKTDSIKIPNATPSIIQFVMDFAKKYGYDFEHEATYERMCLVNKAVYIAKYANNECHKFRLSTGEVINTPWTATGSEFQHPYIFKELFAKVPIAFEDMCETKNVKSALYLDMNEGYPLHAYTQEEYESDLKGAVDRAVEKEQKKGVDNKAKRSEMEIRNDVIRKYKGPKVGDLVETHNYVFIGRAGQFSPMVPGSGGGELVRDQDGKMVSVTDSSGYRWLESEMVRNLKMEDSIDISYYRKKVDQAVEDISQYGDFDRFVSNDSIEDLNDIP